MKTGKSLVELAEELTRQRECAKDYLADTKALRLTAEYDSGTDGASGRHSIDMCDGSARVTMIPTDLFHRQLGAHVGIPAAYYDRMRTEQPGLLSVNVNMWLDALSTRRMVRTFERADDYPIARAFLSDRYRPLDNYDLASSVIPRLQDCGAEVKSTEVTERNLYIKATVPGTTREIVRKGYFDSGTEDRIDIIEPGIVISNSEVGHGALSIVPGVHTIKCTNLAVWKGNGLRKYHVGRAADAGDEIWSVLTDETRRVVDKALWAQVSDMVEATLSGDIFDQLVESLQAAAGMAIGSKPVKAVEVLAKQVRLSETESDSVLEHLIRGGDLSQYGLHAAVTRAAQDIESYDRATELEELGARIIDLPAHDWSVIAKAA